MFYRVHIRITSPYFFSSQMYVPLFIGFDYIFSVSMMYLNFFFLKKYSEKIDEDVDALKMKTL